MKIISKELKVDILKTLDRPRSTFNIKCKIEDTQKYPKINWKTILTRLEGLEEDGKVTQVTMGEKNKIRMWSK